MSVHVEDIAGYMQTERDITKILDDAGVELGGGDDPLPFRIKKLIDIKDAQLASLELERERAQREANEASGIARERGKKLIAVEGTLRDAGVPMDDRTHDEGVAWLATKCEQLRRMHDGVSADLDRERREHQEAMAEAAARELKLAEELDAACCVRDEAMQQRGVFMEQRDKAIRDVEFFKGEAEAAIRAITKAQTAELHERLTSPKRRSKPKTTKKPKAVAKRSRRKP